MIFFQNKSKNNNYLSFLAKSSLSLILLTAIAINCGDVLSIPTSATNTQVTANLAEVLSLSVSEQDINLSLMPATSGVSTSASTTVDVSTNSTSGYQLTMSAAHSSINSTTSDSKIESISNATTSSPQPLTANTWGWYSDNLGTFNNLYVSLPASGSERLVRKTENNATASPTVVNFGVNVDLSLPAGTYSNTIVFTAISNSIPSATLASSPISPAESNAIDVYPSTGWGGDTVTITSNGLFQNVESVTVGGTNCMSYAIDSANMIRCVLPNLPVNNSGYMVAVSTDSGPVDLSNLTIRYIDPYRVTITGNTTTEVRTMQDFTAENCLAMDTYQVATLTDERNNQSYRIRKMPDNKCWMIDNLKYAGESNTDLANSDGTYGIIFNNSSSTYNTQNGQVSPYSSNNFDKAFYNNPASQSYCHDSGIANSYTGCGFFYNWYAATAGTGIYETPEPNVNVTGSICPSGWSLPSGTSDGTTPTSTGSSYAAADFPVLNASMLAGYPTTGTYISEGYYQNWQYNSPWEGVFAGQRRNSFVDAGTTQIYWTSTAYQSNDGTKSSARTLTVTNTLVAPGADFAIKPSGLAVRCVLRIN